MNEQYIAGDRSTLGLTFCGAVVLQPILGCYLHLQIHAIELSTMESTALTANNGTTSVYSLRLYSLIYFPPPACWKGVWFGIHKPFLYISE